MGIVVILSKKEYNELIDLLNNHFDEVEELEGKLSSCKARVDLLSSRYNEKQLKISKLTIEIKELKKQLEERGK